MDLEDGLNKLLLGRYDDALAVFTRWKAAPQAAKLIQITHMLREITNYAAELSRGNLAAKTPGMNNQPATELQALHAKLTRLAQQLLMVTKGTPVPRIDYLGDLSESLNLLITQAFLRREQAEHDRNHDTETGLLTRKAFIRGVYDMLQARRDSVGVLFCCLLDNIKYINDAYGYDSGDLYIAKVVEVLRLCENGSSLLARLGGNEFAMYAHGFNTGEEAYGFAQDRFKVLFNTKVSLPHGSVKIRASCGVALYPQDATASDILMNYASHATFEAQNLNRGTIMRFSPEIYRAKASLLSRQEGLDELIEGKLITFAFQPIVNLKNAGIVGYEALMRPLMREFVTPLEVLSLAETQSKLSQLEKVTFDVIFDWVYKNFHRLGDRKIFFNTISIQYLDIDELKKIHPDYARISKSMVFEILENASVESALSHRVDILRRELSTLVAIDDFGCGHSNAIRLISISPDILKVDRFFINNIHNAPAPKKELLSNILDYCRAKGILSVAEGVETYEELESVIRMGFNYAQGFYLGHPEAHLAELDPRLAAEINALGGDTR